MLKLVLFTIGGAIAIGLMSVAVCRSVTTTPKFCGLMFFYASPAGALIGFITGLATLKKS